MQRSFSPIRSTYGKCILILVSFSCISLARVCFCYWGKLWLLVIPLKISPIMLSWYPFCFNTCFILALSLVMSSLLVIMDYALLNKEKTTLFSQLVWWWELQYRHWSVCVGFPHTSTEIFLLFRFNKVSRNASSPLSLET